MEKRHISQDFVNFIDKRLYANGLAQEAIKNKDARTLLAQAAQACVGIREHGGNNRGPLVSLIQSTIGKADHVAWCMSFVQTLIAYVETKTGLVSPIFASEHCLTVWQNTPSEQRVQVLPLAGAIVIWRHGHSTSGHTGIVLSCDEKIFQAIEGNTEGGIDPNGKVERDGGGVYHTKRSRLGNGDMRVVGFLKPF
jgi:hypothetical protein